MAAKTPDHIADRLRDIRGKMNGLSCEGLLVTNMVHVRYLSGFTGTEAALLIRKMSQYLMTDSRYVTQAGKQAKGYKVIQITRRDQGYAENIINKNVKNLAFEPDGMTHARYLDLKKLLKGVKLVRFDDTIRKKREVKTDAEARLIKKAADIAKKAFDDVAGKIAPGMTENEVAAMLEAKMRELGSEKVPFDTIVASGKRGALPHGVASDKKLGKGDLVTIDFGAVYKGYQSDQTITVSLGKPSAKKREIYEIVRSAQEKAIAIIRPGAVMMDIDAAAREHIKGQGYGKYFGHGLGHGVGLETHEGPSLAPSSKDKLKTGNVVTVEPGIYIPSFGGVRIEDMVIVTRTGCRPLTNSGGPLREL